MSSVSDSCDYSGFVEPSHLLEFDKTYALGDHISEEVAEKVVEHIDKNLRKGELVLVRQEEASDYVYAVFKGECEDGSFGYDTGNGALGKAEIHDIFKIKNSLCFPSSEGGEERAIGRPAAKKPLRVSWAFEKKIRIIKGSSSPESIHDAILDANTSTYKYLLTHKAISQDVRKFLDIAIIKEIAKKHHFTKHLALAALKIRVLHDDELLTEFEKAINDLEAIEDQHDNAEHGPAKEITAERCATASTILTLFMNELTRRGLDASARKS